MFIKPLTTPLKLQILQASLGRLPENYPKLYLIQEQYNKRSAGFWGEQQIEYHLKSLQEEKYFIFHDLRLPYKDSYFQIDFLIFTQCYALILEGKNLAGTIYFDGKFKQLIRTKNGQDTAFDDPITQAEIQREKLLNWFNKNKFPPLPVHFQVLISNPSTIIRSNPEYGNIAKKVCRLLTLNQRIAETDQMYCEEKISIKDLKRQCRLILKSHTEPSYDILQKYNIPLADIQKGVKCPYCNTFSMVYKAGWHCQICKTKSKDAHISALNDYFLLINKTITNNEFREFLQIPSIRKANYLLAKLGYPSFGAKKVRSYHLQ